MKILVVHNAYQSHHVGGEDVVVQNELNALKKALGDEKVFEYIVSNDEIRPLNLMIKLWGDDVHFKKIAKLVKENHIDIVHVHNFFPLLTPTVFAGAKYAGAKVVHTLHNFRWWCSAGILYRDNQSCEKCIDKTFGWPAVLHKCYRNSTMQSLAANMAFTWYRIKDYTQYIDSYFVLTHFQQRKLQSHIPHTKMFLKPNGIVPTKKSIEPCAKKDYLFVGRLESAKGIDLLLATWRNLPAQFNLKVIGTGENEDALRQEYESERICFLGKLPHDEVLAYMAKSKYFIHASLTYETFGLTLVEALSVGTPVIAIDIGPRKEFVQTGKNGFLCKKEDLGETILSAHDYQDYASLSENAVKSAQPFYMENVIKQQIGYYQTLLSSKEVCHASAF